MNVNHINLGVTEIMPTVAMFETYFGLRRADGPINDKMAFLLDDAGALVSLFKVKDPSYPKTFHIGFIRDDIAEVRAIHARLTADGFAPEAPREEHGRLTFYFQAPGGFTIEVNAFLDSSTLRTRAA